MTIRKYCTYYRIANEVYEAYHRKRGFRGRIHTDPQDVPEELRDVAYYKRKKFVDVTEMYDIGVGSCPANSAEIVCSSPVTASAIA